MIEGLDNIPGSYLLNLLSRNHTSGRETLVDNNQVGGVGITKEIPILRPYPIYKGLDARDLDRGSVYPPVPSLDYSMGNPLVIEARGALVDQFFPVREEENPLLGRGRLVDDRSGQGCLSGSSSGVRENGLGPGGPMLLYLSLGFGLVGSKDLGQGRGSDLQDDAHGYVGKYATPSDILPRRRLVDGGLLSVKVAWE